MKLKVSRRIWLAQILIGNAIVLGLFVTHGVRAGNEPVPLSTDWSHRHLVFSPPKNLLQQFQLSGDVRYFQQRVRRNVARKEQESDEREDRDRDGDTDRDRRRRHRNPRPDQLERDWSMYLGSGGTVGAGNFPAKFSFNATVANCVSSGTPDFVVYNTSLAPSAAGTKASSDQTFTGNTATNGQTFTITNNHMPAPNTLTLYANTGADVSASGTIAVNTQPVAGDTVVLGSVTYTFENPVAAGSQDVLIDTTNAGTAQNLQAAIDDDQTECANPPTHCFSSGGIGAPNPAVLHPAAFAGHTVTVTASTDGFSGDFALTTTSAHITVAGGAQGAGSNTGLDFLDATSTTVAATNLAAAIARNGASIGVTSTSSGAVVTVKATNTGNGTAWTLVGPVTGLTITSPLAGGAAGASIVAYDNIYSGCTGTVPSVFWAYNTGGKVATSPVLSLDGTQVAFVQNVGTTGQLVLLKWKSSATDTVDAPTTLTTQTVANYRACVAPCMLTMAFPVAVTDTNSSPFYDYANDIIYVGDDGGTLRRFNNVFKGTPAQQAVSGFPHVVTNTGVLTSPVFEKVSGKVFVGSSSGSLTAVRASDGVETQSGAVGGANGINDSPIVDTTNGNVYVIVSDTTATPTMNASGIYRFTVGFAGGTTGAQTVVSTNHNFTSIHQGDFNNAFYSGAAGQMYVCGPNPGGAHSPTLYQIDVSALGVLGTVTIGPKIGSGSDLSCSGVTEVFNPNATGGAKDFIFVSVTDNGQGALTVPCPTPIGCLMSFDVTSVTSVAPITASTSPSATIASPGGSSGVVVDNTVGSGTLGGASQVYYAPLADGNCTTSGVGVVGGCAVQASQSGLI